jgi:hypothetical protein
MPNNIHIFKVALAEWEGIWRKIAVKGNQTLDDLHEAIFDAFDRYDEHMYSFYLLKSAIRRNPSAVEILGE